jgi:precorrin-8X/cobalt-precorrin-8 methylmutase
MVYASGDLALAGLTRVHPDAVSAGLDAIRAGAAIVCDVRMVAAGLRPSDNPVHVAVEAASQICHSEQACPERSRTGGKNPLGGRGATRSATGIQSLEKELDGGIAVIGNAPTALLALLDLVDDGRCQPALVIGTPVGFVAAAESKQELLKRDLPSITVEGTRGGSAVAAAAMNALLIIAGR